MHHFAYQRKLTTSVALVLSIPALALIPVAAIACSCAKPQPPDIPADTFIEEMANGELNAKQSAVKDYILEVSDYQQCLVDCIKDVNYELTDISVEAERVVADWKRVVELRDTN